MDGVVRITNYFEHPENSRYMVYSFFLEEHADYFQSLLRQSEPLEAVLQPQLAEVLCEAANQRHNTKELQKLDRQAWLQMSRVEPALLTFLRKNIDKVLRRERSL